MDTSSQCQCKHAEGISRPCRRSVVEGGSLISSSSQERKRIEEQPIIRQRGTTHGRRTLTTR